MMEVVIAYEDRLRLSELFGQLAREQFTMDNLFWFSVPWGIGIGLLLGFLLVLTLHIDWEDSYRPLIPENKALIPISIVSLCLFCCVFVYVLNLFETQSNILDLQAQIEEIYRLWGVEG